jgi:hypothetical protein
MRKENRNSLPRTLANEDRMLFHFQDLKEDGLGFLSTFLRIIDAYTLQL